MQSKPSPINFCTISTVLSTAIRVSRIACRSKNYLSIKPENTRPLLLSQSDMGSSILDRKNWLASLKYLSEDENYARRFSILRIKSGVTFSEFLANEKAFYRSLKKALENSDFKIVSAKKSELGTKSKRHFFSFDIFETFIYNLVNEGLKSGMQAGQSLRTFGRPGAGAEKALVDLKSFLAQSIGKRIWIIRRDLKDFGMSVPHDPLLLMMQEKLSLDLKDLDLIKALINFEYKDLDGTTKKNLKGTPTGTRLQQLVNGFYLSDLDRQIEKSADYYIRYGDDILVASYEESRHQQLITELDSGILNLGLVINTKKSLEFEFKEAAYLDKSSEGKYLSYLGRNIDRSGKILVSKEQYKKIKKDIELHLRKTEKLVRSLSREEKIRVLCKAATALVRAEVFSSSAVSSHHLVKIDCRESLRKFDSWLATKVLQIGLNKGFKHSNFRFYSPTELRRMGLINITRWR